MHHGNRVAWRARLLQTTALFRRSDIRARHCKTVWGSTNKAVAGWTILEHGWTAMAALGTGEGGTSLLIRLNSQSLTPVVDDGFYRHSTAADLLVTIAIPRETASELSWLPGAREELLRESSYHPAAVTS